MYICMYVCMYVCIFIKLHISTQSGPVIRVILCHSHFDPPKGGSMILVTKTSDKRDKGDTLSLLVQILLEP